MPQLRSFTGFAPGPNLSEAYQGGYNIVQQQQALAQKAQSDRDQIANQYAIAEMEAATKRAALQQQALQQAQELEVTKSIKQQQLGLQARELEQQQQLAQQQMALTGRHYDTEAQKEGVIAGQAAQKYEAQQRMRMAVEEAISQGKTPAEALAGATAIYGAQSGADIRKLEPNASRAGAAAMGVPTAIDLKDEQGNPTGQKIYQASPNRYATLPKNVENPTESTPVPGSDGTILQYGKKFFPNPKVADITEMSKKRDAITKTLDSGVLEPERRQFVRAQDPDQTLTPNQRAMAQKYADKLAEFKTLNDQITEARTSMRSGGRATLPSGLDTGGTTNKIGRFKVIQRAR